MAMSKGSDAVEYDPGGTPVTGRRVLLIVLAFFAVIIAANVTMMTFALNNFGGLVVANSYVASQRFNQDVAAARAAPSASWRFEAAADLEGVTLTIHDADGAPVAPPGLRGVLGRPSHQRDDVAVAFELGAPGVYRTDVPLKPGAWRLSLAIDGPNGPIARRVDVFLSPNTRLR
ncbi:MAG: FixH family protein [Rhodobacteraceae bacterium]|nr:FixH family protein [Paracoccaceae bacterium]